MVVVGKVEDLVVSGEKKGWLEGVQDWRGWVRGMLVVPCVGGGGGRGGGRGRGVGG